MSKKLLTTPRSRVKNALRQVWLRSRERAAAIKREKNTCERCQKKGSVAKGKEVAIRVHHRDGIDWDGVVDLIFDRVLVLPAKLEVLCTGCHDKEHGAQPVQPASAPKEYLACAKFVGDVVVARNPEGHMGYVRKAREADAGLPRWTEALGW